MSPLDLGGGGRKKYCSQDEHPQHRDLYQKQRRILKNTKLENLQLR